MEVKLSADNFNRKAKTADISRQIIVTLFLKFELTEKCLENTA